jgi:hypothetical protein
MATTTWVSFYDDLLPLVPGCSQAMADKVLLRAAQEWHERTLCWRSWLYDVTTTTDENTYAFGFDARSELVQLLRSRLDGQEQDVLTADSIPANWQADTSWCDRKGIFTTDNANFVLVPMPAADLVVSNEVALRPSNAATGVDSAIFARYGYEIALGAAARLHEMPGKPYSDANSTARARFETAIARAASDVWHGSSRAPQRVRARFL